MKKTIRPLNMLLGNFFVYLFLYILIFNSKNTKFCTHLLSTGLGVWRGDMLGKKFPGRLYENADLTQIVFNSQQSTMQSSVGHPVTYLKAT